MKSKKYITPQTDIKVLYPQDYICLNACSDTTDDPTMLSKKRTHGGKQDNWEDEWDSDWDD